jgi:hypothetical protein
MVPERFGDAAVEPARVNEQVEQVRTVAHGDGADHLTLTPGHEVDKARSIQRRLVCTLGH